MRMRCSVEFVRWFDLVTRMDVILKIIVLASVEGEYENRGKRCFSEKPPTSNNCWIDEKLTNALGLIAGSSIIMFVNGGTRYGRGTKKSSLESRDLWWKCCHVVGGTAKRRSASSSSFYKNVLCASYPTLPTPPNAIAITYTCDVCIYVSVDAIFFPVSTNRLSWRMIPHDFAVTMKIMMMIMTKTSISLRQRTRERIRTIVIYKGYERSNVIPNSKCYNDGSFLFYFYYRKQNHHFLFIYTVEDDDGKIIRELFYRLR